MTGFFFCYTLAVLLLVLLYSRGRNLKSERNLGRRKKEMTKKWRGGEGGRET